MACRGIPQTAERPAATRVGGVSRIASRMLQNSTLREHRGAGMSASPRRAVPAARREVTVPMDGCLEGVRGRAG